VEGVGELDILTTVAKDYGLFVALVVFYIWDNRQRESKLQQERDVFIAETRKREQLYIDREERYIGIVESLTESFEGMQKDVSEIKNVLNIKDSLVRR
jgi:hypothetical protein